MASVVALKLVSAVVAAVAADPAGIVTVYTTVALLPVRRRPSLNRRRVPQVTVTAMLVVSVTPLACLITSFIASVPFVVCIDAHCAASAVLKVNEPEIVLVPVVGAPSCLV